MPPDLFAVDTTAADVDGPAPVAIDGSPEHVLREAPGTRCGPTPELSVVVPARDERANVGPLVDEIVAALEGRYRFEIVFVDDASTDGTLDELVAVRDARAPMLRIVAHAAARGQSFALVSGVRAARGALVATLDADGQNVPGDIPAMVALAQAHPPGVHFCIAGHRRSRRDTRWKRFQSGVANRVRAAILDDPTPDTGCGLKVMPRETWLALPAFDHVHRFVPALVRRLGGSVSVHEVRHRPRLHESSKYGMWDRLLPGVVDLAGMLWLGRRLRGTEAREVGDA